MTELDVMKSTDPWYEVVRLAPKVTMGDMVIKVAEVEDVTYLVIEETGKELFLTGAEAHKVAEYIRANVRKRW